MTEINQNVGDTCDMVKLGKELSKAGETTYLCSHYGNQCFVPQESGNQSTSRIIYAGIKPDSLNIVDNEDC